MMSLLVLQLHGFAERYHPAVALNSDVKSAKQQTGIRAFLKEISTDNIPVPKQGQEGGTFLNDRVLWNSTIICNSFCPAVQLCTLIPYI
jgi:hypothetical protein